MKFFQHILEYITNIFNRDKKIFDIEEKDNLEQISNQEQIIEDYEYLYNQIEIGDIIWAKRYQDEIEKEAFPEGHREGPFVVLKKENGNLISIEGTSVVPYKEYVDVNFYLNNEGYNLNKETYFKLSKLCFIKEYSFIKYMDKLKDKDRNSLFRQIKLSKKVYYTGKNQIISLNFPIQVGDVVNYNSQSFMVLDINENNMICVPVKNNLDYKDNTNLDFNNFINIDFSKSLCLKITNNIKYVNAVSNKCIESILKGFQEYIDICKNVEITQRGSVIFKDSKFYYIYGEEGQEWLVFEIYKQCIKNSEMINIGNNKYYTKYEDFKINKKDKFDNLHLCTEDNKDKIKISRKKYKEQEKNKKIYGTVEGANFKIGDIIENINYKNRRYIIFAKHKNTYECISIDRIKKGIYDPILIRKIDCKLSKDTSLNGIVWLENRRDFDLKRIANKEIMDIIFRTQIRYLKDNEINEQLELNSQSINNENAQIRTSSIVKTNEFSDETFVVKKILGDTLVCVSRADYRKTNPIKHYLKKKEVFVVEDVQKRK